MRKNPANDSNVVQYHHHVIALIKAHMPHAFSIFESAIF